MAFGLGLACDNIRIVAIVVMVNNKPFLVILNLRVSFCLFGLEALVLFVLLRLHAKTLGRICLLFKLERIVHVLALFICSYLCFSTSD